MTVDEARKAFEDFKAQGNTDDEILAALYAMFQEDKINVNELEALIHVLGYEFTDDFKNMSPEDQKTKGYEETEEEDESEDYNYDDMFVEGDDLDTLYIEPEQTESVDETSQEDNEDEYEPPEEEKEIMRRIFNDDNI